MEVYSLSCFGSKYTAPKAGALRFGQWIWYRSMRSVRRRFRLSSQACTISAAVRLALPLRIQSMLREGPATLVASTTLSRTPGRAANQLPMMRSVAP